MDTNATNVHLFTYHSLRGSDIVYIENKTADEDDRNTLFVNYATIAWHEMRRAWRGDRSGASQRKPREPTRHRCSSNHSYYTSHLKLLPCSSSTLKEELISSTENFDGPVPLSKMVEFLVEVWEEDFQD